MSKSLPAQALPTVDCDTASDIDSRIAELEYTDYIEYDKSYDMICDSGRWTNQDRDGNPTPQSKCYNGEWNYSEVLFAYVCRKQEGCYNYAQGLTRCNDDGEDNGGDEGGSGQEDPPGPSTTKITCQPGYYINYNDGTCEKCPDYSVYNTRTGAFIKTYAGVVTSPTKTFTPGEGSDTLIDLCYVPKGSMLYNDNSGTFRFDVDCPYYGDGTF